MLIILHWQKAECSFFKKSLNQIIKERTEYNMFLLLSIIVYGFMMWIMDYFGNIAYRKQYPQGINGIDLFDNKKIGLMSLLTKNYYFIPIFVFCLFSAIRYKVGVDSVAYKSYFYEILQHGRLLTDGAAEQGFVVLGKFTSYFTDSHYLFFFILAFLQIVFIYYALRKRNYALKYIGVSIILSGFYFSLMNGVRQYIVACAFVAMISLITEKKKWWLFVLAVFICSFMHKSAFILLPIGLLSYFVLSKGILSIKLQLLIVAVCYIMMDKIDVSFLDTFFALGEKAGYATESIEAYTGLEATEKNFGLWAFMILFVQIFIILNSKRIQEISMNDKMVVIMYNLFFIGVCVKTLFYNNFTIGRLSYYLAVFQPIMLSTMLFITSISDKKKDKYIYNSTIFLLSVSFLYLLYIASGNLITESTLYKFDLFQN